MQPRQRFVVCQLLERFLQGLLSSVIKVPPHAEYALRELGVEMVEAPRSIGITSA
jgi:hypothetical protein